MLFVGTSLDSWLQLPQDYFLNKIMEVKGTVEAYRKRPQIRVDHASQITVVDQDSDKE